MFTPMGASAQTIAYEIAPGTVGNQEFGGSLGLDFNVIVPIEVVELGSFDSGSDGISLPITVQLWSRDDAGTPAESIDDFGSAQLASLTFSPGDDGAAVGGSRFKALPSPLTLGVGSYTIVASGFGAGEPNGNTPNPAANGRTTNNGGGVIEFVGTSRFGDAGTFPASADSGPEQRYAAGTFSYSLPDSDEDGIPDAIEDANGLDKDNPDDAEDDADSDGSTNLEEYQNGTGINDPDSDDDTILDGAETNTGSFVDANDRGTDPLDPDSDRDGLGDRIESGSGVLVDEDDTGSSPVEFDSDMDGFDDGIELFGLTDPNDPDTKPDDSFGIETYRVANGLAGNQGFDGTLGLDFDLTGTIKVQQLGVFDDGGDGLINPLTVELWQRDNGGTPDVPTDDSGVSVLATATINPGEGALQGANRFKRLATELELMPGSYSIVAHGFGPDDLNANVGPLPPGPEGLTTTASLAITFVGSSRFGADGTEGLFPDRPDGGAPNQYGAGTFSFTTDDADGDGLPDFYEDANGLLKNDPSDADDDPDGDNLDNLAEFQNNTNPQQADTDADGVNDDIELANQTDPNLPDSDGDGLDDGDEILAGTDPLDPDSDDDTFSDGREIAEGSDPNNPDDTPVISFVGELAYTVVQGSVGNQAFGGGLGADFVVNETITVLELGAFDSGADGLQRDIRVRLWARDDVGTPDDLTDDTGTLLAELLFDSINPGDLRDGHRVRKLAEPLLLAPGSYTISASGYGIGEMNGNLGVLAPVFDPLNLSTTADPALSFVGSARYGGNPDVFPPTPDAELAPYRYAAGTFAFETLPDLPFEITALVYDEGAGTATLTWNSAPGALYSIDRSTDLRSWLEVTDSVPSDGTSTTVTVPAAAPGGRLYLRVVLP